MRLSLQTQTTSFLGVSVGVRARPRRRVGKPSHHPFHPRIRNVVAPSASSPFAQKTWSNPTGAVLDEIVTKTVYAAARPFVWNEIDVGGRMVIVKLRDGSLWVHSPVSLDEETRRAVDALGCVKHVVSPNYEHVKYAKEWKEAYPNCTLYGCPLLKEKKPDIPYDVDLVNGTPEAWMGEFDMEWFSCEETPIVGGAFFNEVVFHHRPSGTLCVTDVFWNYPSDTVGDVSVPLWTRVWKFLMDQVYLPLYKRLMVVDREGYEASARRVSEEWQWSTLIPCHGTVIRGDRARAALRSHLLD